jgi:hypothetical protein
MPNPAPCTPDALRAALERAARDFPGWETWCGVGGLLYARRLKSSPPKIVRATSITELRAKISDAMGGTR